MRHHHRPSRRRFLATATSTAFAAPWFVPRSVLGDAANAPASDRVRVGYIGCGRRSAQLRGLPKDAVIVAAADCYLPRAESVAARYSGKGFQDYRKMLEMPDLDAVVVATPDHWHTLPCVHAIQAGKDCYVEKPMTLTIREGRQLVHAARKHRRIVQCGSQQRSASLHEAVCRLIREGGLGKISRVEAANFESPWECGLPEQPIPSGLDWDMWIGQTQPWPYHKDIYTPRANPGWISFRPWSGGEMTGWGAHGLDQIQWALGMDESGPVEIWTQGEPFDPPTYRAPATRDAGNKACSSPTVMMRYDGDIELAFTGAGRGGGTFHGTKGTIWMDRGNVKADPPELLEPIAEAIRSRGDTTGSHLAHWIDCIKTRRRPVADVETGHRSATVCHLGNIARWTGRRLKWDPQTERFEGDDQANALVAREQRKGFEIPDV